MNITIKLVISISNVCRYWRGGIRSVFLLTFLAINSFAQNPPTPPPSLEWNF